MDRAVRALEDLLPVAWGAKVPIYIICSCSNLNMPEAKIELSIPHLRMDLTNERGCFAMSSSTNPRDQDAMICMREEITRISQENNQETPSLLYGYRFYNHRENIELPLVRNNGNIED